MKNITVSLLDSDDESVTAEYFQIEDGWITFKTGDHKAVVAYPEKRVTRIKSEAEAARTIEFNVSGLGSAEDIERRATAMAENAARWGHRK